MLHRRKIPLAVLLLAGFFLSACSGTGHTVDPLDWISADWLNPKTPLPGERKPVFPDGVPGVPQGVPKELVKGYQQEQAAVEATEPPPEAAPKPAPKPQAARPAPKPRTAAAPATTTRAAAPQQQPKPAGTPAAEWPDASTPQLPNTTRASSAPAAKEIPQANWPAPDTTTFSR